MAEVRPFRGSSGVVSRGLENPVRALYREVSNDSASWTDAVFWMCLGAALTLLGQWVI